MAGERRDPQTERALFKLSGTKDAYRVDIEIFDDLVICERNLDLKGGCCQSYASESIPKSTVCGIEVSTGPTKGPVQMGARCRFTIWLARRCLLCSMACLSCPYLPSILIGIAGIVISIVLVTWPILLQSKCLVHLQLSSAKELGLASDFAHRLHSSIGGFGAFAVILSEKPDEDSLVESVYGVSKGSRTASQGSSCSVYGDLLHDFHSEFATRLASITCHVHFYEHIVVFEETAKLALYPPSYCRKVVQRSQLHGIRLSQTSIPWGHMLAQTIFAGALVAAVLAPLDAAAVNWYVFSFFVLVALEAVFHEKALCRQEYAVRFDLLQGGAAGGAASHLTMTAHRKPDDDFRSYVRGHGGSGSTTISEVVIPDLSAKATAGSSHLVSASLLAGATSGAADEPTQEEAQDTSRAFEDYEEEHEPAAASPLRGKARGKTKRKCKAEGGTPRAGMVSKGRSSKQGAAVVIQQDEAFVPRVPAEREVVAHRVASPIVAALLGAATEMTAEGEMAAAVAPTEVHVSLDDGRRGVEHHEMTSEESMPSAARLSVPLVLIQPPREEKQQPSGGQTKGSDDNVCDLKREVDEMFFHTSGATGSPATLQDLVEEPAAVEEGQGNHVFTQRGVEAIRQDAREAYEAAGCPNVGDVVTAEMAEALAEGGATLQSLTEVGYVELCEVTRHKGAGPPRRRKKASKMMQPSYVFTQRGIDAWQQEDADAFAALGGPKAGDLVTDDIMAALAEGDAGLESLLEYGYVEEVVEPLAAAALEGEGHDGTTAISAKVTKVVKKVQMRDRISTIHINCFDPEVYRNSQAVESDLSGYVFTTDGCHVLPTEYKELNVVAGFPDAGDPVLTDFVDYIEDTNTDIHWMIEQGFVIEGTPDEKE